MRKLTVIAFVLLSFAVRAQFVEQAEKPELEKQSDTDVGVGSGLDYGGIGVRLTTLLDPHFALFGSVGYDLLSAGYNVGAKARFNPKSRFVVTSGAMYGYNGTLAIKDNSVSLFKKTYYGPSLFAGMEFHGKYRQKNYFSAELIVPIRPGKYQQDIDYWKSQGATGLNDPTPVTISIGYHFGL